MATTMDEPVTRRDFIYIATTAFATIGGAAALWPMISQMNPDASALSLASTELDLAPIQEGQAVTVMWRGKPIFVRHRTGEEIKTAQDVPLSELKDQVARITDGPDIPATREPDQAGQGAVAGDDRDLHASRLHPERPEERRREGCLRRLVLPLPWIDVRYRGAHSPGAGAAESCNPALCVRVRHQDQDRLSR